MEKGEHVKIKNQIKDIYDVDVFRDLIERCMISDEAKLILSMYYIQRKSLNFIADELGWSYATIKRRHSEALSKLKPLL